MAHLRSQIFEAVKTQLKTIAGFNGEGKVERTRRGPINQEALPAITITWADDDEQSSFRPGATIDAETGYDREVPISIIVHLRNDEMDAAFDELALLIENKIAEDNSFGGLAIEAELVSSRFFVEKETGIALNAGRLVYRVHYKTQANPEQLAL